MTWEIAFSWIIVCIGTSILILTIAAVLTAHQNAKQNRALEAARQGVLPPGWTRS